MRILFALSGLHSIDRGAEIAFISVADELSRRGHHVTLAGSGVERATTDYQFIHVPCISRKYFQKFPTMPIFRDVTSYEELSFAPGLLWKYNPNAFDVTLACSFPFTNWVLRRPTWNLLRPPHVYVTENGDWPARSNNAEFKFFSCDGLICINPDFYEINRKKWFSALIPNGVDAKRFGAGKPDRPKFGIPPDRIIVLMVSALISSKRVDVAIEAVNRVPHVHLVVAGDGPLRGDILDRAQQLLPGRFTNLTVQAADMPNLYCSADIFLHMSLEESFGNVFVEAMASGLPIIAHHSQRHNWIIGDNGSLIDTQNAAVVADCIAQTAPLTQQHCKSLRQAASRFDWSKIAIEYETFLDQVIEKSRPRYAK